MKDEFADLTEVKSQGVECSDQPGKIKYFSFLMFHYKVKLI